MAEWEKCGMVGMPHKSGGGIFGVPAGYSRELWAAGTPMVSSLVKSSLTPLIREVDVYDLLDVRFDGERWHVERDGVLVGRLGWTLGKTVEPSWVDGKTLEIRDGIFEVRTVHVTDHGVIVNCGGIVRPV